MSRLWESDFQVGWYGHPKNGVIVDEFVWKNQNRMHGSFTWRSGWWSDHVWVCIARWRFGPRRNGCVNGHLDDLDDRL